MNSFGKIPDYVRADLITGSSDMNNDDLKEAFTHDNQADQQLIQFNTAWGQVTSWIALLRVFDLCASSECISLARRTPQNHINHNPPTIVCTCTHV